MKSPEVYAPPTAWIMEKIREAREAQEKIIREAIDKRLKELTHERFHMEIMWHLKRMNFWPYPISPGLIGKLPEAVKKFQKAVGLPPTGNYKYPAFTWKYIIEERFKPKPPVKIKPFYIPLALGFLGLLILTRR